MPCRTPEPTEVGPITGLLGWRSWSMEGLGVTELPTGTVTFLFTDLEGSTRLWEEHPEAMRAALARHDEILRTAVEKREGVVVRVLTRRRTGDRDPQRPLPSFRKDLGDAPRL